jgi:hypothetical protein
MLTTFAVVVVPPSTVLGDKEIESGANGSTVKGFVKLTVPESTVIYAVVEAGTGNVATSKVAELFPGATTTLDGAETTEGLELVIAIGTPPAGAGPFNSTSLSVMATPAPTL